MLVIILFQCIFKFFTWSRLVKLLSSDEIKIFYLEHDFQVDLENFEFNLKFHAESIQHYIHNQTCLIQRHYLIMIGNNSYKQVISLNLTGD